MADTVVFVDVDDTVADLVPVWVNEFLRQYPECSDPRTEKWVDWDIAPQVPESHQEEFWRVLGKPELYDLVKPIPGALEGVEKIRSWGMRVVFVTASVNGHAGAKLRWLVNHGFLDTLIRNRNYIETFDKSLLRGNLIIDDRPQTCRKFAAVNGGRRSALLYLRPPAIGLEFRENLIAATDWENVVERADWMLRGA